MYIGNEKPTSIFTEAYRGIKTSIEYSSVDKKLKTLMVTSAEPGAGKSTVCINLAYVLAQGDKKVVIVDCDLRKPNIHMKFRLTNNKGLTDYFIGKVKFKDIVRSINNNLDVITSGNRATNPAEIISSKAMESLFDELKEQYDYILIDTPPVKIISDGVVLSTKCDGVVYVIRAGKTKKDDIVEGYMELEKVKAKVIGSILNGTDNRRDNYYYYYDEN